MIVFTVSLTAAIGDRFFTALAAARMFAVAIVTEEGDEAVVLSSVTAPKLRGAELVLAALNRRGWMFPGSMREVERWKRVDGEVKKLVSRKLDPSLAMSDSKEELGGCHDRRRRKGPRVQR